MLKLSTPRTSQWYASPEITQVMFTRKCRWKSWKQADRTLAVWAAALSCCKTKLSCVMRRVIIVAHELTLLRSKPWAVNFHSMNAILVRPIVQTDFGPPAIMCLLLRIISSLHKSWKYLEWLFRTFKLNLFSLEDMTRFYSALQPTCFRSFLLNFLPPQLLADFGEPFAQFERLFQPTTGSENLWARWQTFRRQPLPKFHIFLAVIFDGRPGDFFSVP